MKTIAKFTLGLNYIVSNYTYNNTCLRACNRICFASTRLGFLVYEGLSATNFKFLYDLGSLFDCLGKSLNDRSGNFQY